MDFGSVSYNRSESKSNFILKGYLLLRDLGLFDEAVLWFEFHFLEFSLHVLCNFCLSFPPIMSYFEYGLVFSLFSETIMKKLQISCLSLSFLLCVISLVKHVRTAILFSLILFYSIDIDWILWLKFVRYLFRWCIVLIRLFRFLSQTSSHIYFRLLGSFWRSVRINWRGIGIDHWGIWINRSVLFALGWLFNFFFRFYVFWRFRVKNFCRLVVLNSCVFIERCNMYDLSVVLSESFEWIF